MAAEVLQIGPPPSEAPPAAREGLIVPEAGSLVVKFYSRCHLGCDGCYVFSGPNQTDDWRAMPHQMTRPTMEMVAARLHEDLAARRVRPPEFPIVIHGGEPELANPDDVLHFVRVMREAATPQTLLRFFFVTSGTRTTPQFLDVFRRTAMGVSISLNGDKETNDRTRVYHNGKSTYDDAVAGIRAMTESPLYVNNFCGLLALMDLKAKPKDTFMSLMRHWPPSLSFLFPHGNWHDLPPGMETPEQRAEAPYGKWLGEVFDTWYDDYRWMVHIEFFDSILQLLKGGASGTELIGGVGSDQLVVETDGVYELNDIFKILPGSIGRMPLSVTRHSFKEAMAYAARRTQMIGATAVAPCAAACPVGQVCGGGLTAHRYNQDSEQRPSFDRSVFCADLMYIINHIEKRVAERAAR